MWKLFKNDSVQVVYGRTLPISDNFRYTLNLMICEQIIVRAHEMQPPYTCDFFALSTNRPHVSIRAYFSQNWYYDGLLMADCCQKNNRSQ